MPTVTLTDAQLAALDSLLHGFDPRHEACLEHDEDAHGDESDCIGWGPQATADLMAAWDALDSADPDALRCDLCPRVESAADLTPDWNPETGNHRTCEAAAHA